MLKKCWVTPHEGGLNYLSFASDKIDPHTSRVKVHESTFPADKPQHHVIFLSYLDDDDLLLLQEAITKHFSAAVVK